MMTFRLSQFKHNERTNKLETMTYAWCVAPNYQQALTHFQQMDLEKGKYHIAREFNGTFGTVGTLTK